jgi:predicted nuclease with TOPRIM domain
MTRLKFIFILTAIIAAMGFTVTSLIKENRKLRQDKRHIAKVLVENQQELAYVKDKLGNEVATSEVKDIRIKDLNNIVNNLKDERLQWITEFEGLRKNLRNLELATKINTETILKFETGFDPEVTIVYQGDSVKARPFTYTEPYFYQSGLVLQDRLIVDSLRVEVPIDGIVLWERKHNFLGIRWGKKTYESQFRSKNPNARITGFEQIRIIKK